MWRKLLAWLPIPLLVAAIIAARAAGLDESHKADTLRLVLSFTFYTLVSLGTLLLIGRSFLASGTPGLLLLECGVVLWSLAGTVGDAVSHGDANVNVTIFNSVILLAGLCHLAGAIVSLRPQRALRSRPLWLAAACALALGALGLVTRAALEHWLPVFFIPGQGGTPVRYCVLISAITMFVLSAGLLLAGRRVARTPFTSWYALALLLLAAGLFGVMIQLSLGSVVNWLGRTAQWLGGVYLLLAAVSALRDSHLPLLPPPEKLRSNRYRYGVAIAVVLAAAALRLAFLPMLGTRAVFVMFYPAVMLAALYGGLRAGVLAAILSALVADYFWIEPAGQLSIGSAADWLSIVVFLASCTLISWVAEAMHRAQRRAAVVEAEAVIAAERVRTEETIRAAHTQLSTMLESITDSYYALDRQWRFTQMNRNAARYFGVEPGDFLGRCYWDVFPQIGQTLFETEYRRAVSDGVAVHFEVPSAVVAGRWVEMHVYPSSEGLFVYFRDITERKRAEEESRQGEKRLATDLDAMTRLQELSTLFVREGNLETVLLRIVDTAMAISGADFGTIQLLHPKSSDLKIVAQRGFPQWWLDFWASVSKGQGACGTAMERHERIIVEDVAESPIFAGTAALDIQLKAGVRAVQSTPIVSRSGKPLGMFSTHFRQPHRPDDRTLRLLDLLTRQAGDIIERAQAEAALRQSEERLALAASGTRIGMYEWDVATGCSLGTEQVVRLLGLRPTTTTTFSREYQYHDWAERVHPEDLPRVEAERRRAMGEHAPHETTYRIVWPDGSVHWIADRGVFQRDPQGEPTRMLGILMDITERKRSEAALEEALQRLRFHVENSPLAVIEFDADLRVIRWTKEAERMFGWTAEEMFGKGMYEIPWIHTKDRQKVDKVSENLRTGRDLKNVSPNRNYRKDGSVIHCEWYNSTLLDASGKMASIFSLVLDVTERVKAEEQLKALNDTLEKRVAERTAEAQHRTEQLRALAAQLTQAEQKERQRLALVLHDHLQQLLVGMKFSMTMLRGHIQGDDGRQILHQLGDLVDESIDTSRGLTIELCPPILTKGTMSEVLHWLAGWFASKHGLRVEVQTDEQVHPPTEQVRVLLFQAVRELLFNIVKHAGVDRACVEMTRLEEGRVCVTVTDAGAGFDPAQARPGGGEAGGFGLFSLRERIEMIGGQLQIDSAPGKGTRSTLIAPMQLAGDLAKGADTAVGAALPLAAAAGTLAEPGGDGGAQAIRVLLADDHQVMRDGLAQLLQAEAGIKVVGKAADGLQVVDMALQLRPDIVVMDVSMPQLDGVEATRRIRCRLPATQVIGLSMFSEANVQDAMLDAGAKAYLAKTAGPEALIAAIRECAREPAIEPGV